MGECITKIHDELWADEVTEDEDTEEWNAMGISKKTVHSKGVLRSTKNHGFSCPEFKPSDAVKARKEQYRFGSRNLNIIPPLEGSIAPSPSTVQGELELFYVHGFNGRFLTCRQNLYLSDDGSQLLYFMASVGVVFDWKTKTQRFFTKHTDDITTICMAPNKKWVATAQKDGKDALSRKGSGGSGEKDLPKIWIWDFSTMESIKLIDKVCWGKIEKVQWSSNSNILYALCGDDKHTLKGYDANNDFQCIVNSDTVNDKIYGIEVSPFGFENDSEGIDEMIMFGKHSFRRIVVEKGHSIKKCTVSIRKFEPKGEVSFGCIAWIDRNIYAVGAQSGRIYICRKDEALKKVKAHDKSVGDLILNQKELISAGYDHVIKHWKWDSEAMTMRVEAARTMTVDDLQPRSMVLHPKSNDLFIGTKKNQIYHISNGGDSNIILNGHHGEVWALCVHPKAPLFITGGHDTVLRVWNAKKREMVSSLTLPVVESTKKKKSRKQPKSKNFVSCGSWSGDGKLLLFGTKDSMLYLVEWEGLEETLKVHQVIRIPRRNRRAPVEAVSNIRFSPCGDIVGVTHFNGRMYLFDLHRNDDGTPSLHQWHATMEHIAAPIQLQFSSRREGVPEVIKTFTRDYEVVHWILNRDKRDCKFCPWIPAPEDIEWVDDPLIAGWSVKGLYRTSQSIPWDGTDLNDVAVTKDGKLAISGDDFATVRLMNYPATKQKPCSEYTNHAEFVVAVKLLADDSQLISCGGADRAVIQWILHKKYDHEAIQFQEENEHKIDHHDDGEPPMEPEPQPIIEQEPEPEPETKADPEPEPQDLLQPEPESVVESNATTTDQDDETYEFNEEWLKKQKLAQYWPLFEAEGYDDFETVSTLKDADFEELGITKEGHRKKLRIRIKKEMKKRKGV